MLKLTLELAFWKEDDFPYLQFFKYTFNFLGQIMGSILRHLPVYDSLSSKILCLVILLPCHMDKVLKTLKKNLSENANILSLQL